MASQPNPSNPRAQRTRTALLDAGFALLAERPIDAIAIDDIVARAGVAKGSFFNHFTDKPGFARALGEQVRLALEARVGAANRDVSDPVLRLAGEHRVWLRPARDQLVYIVTKGLPMGAQMLLISTAGIIFMGLVNRERLAASAAFGASIQLWNYLQMPALAISAAVSAMVASMVEQENPDVRRERVGTELASLGLGKRRRRK